MRTNTRERHALMVAHALRDGTGHFARRRVFRDLHLLLVVFGWQSSAEENEGNEEERLLERKRTCPRGVIVNKIEIER